MNNFDSLELPEVISNSLKAMKFTTPTQIQAETIPVAMSGSDVLGSAQTGTGKTAAYAIPLICHLINNPKSSALVMAPTRELALQVLETMRQLLGKKDLIGSTLLIGGESILKQFSDLRKKPRLIVGTPGRINDHLIRGSLKINTTDFLVLDETDRMLDMGFSIQIDKIIEYLPEKRQTLMFSATIAHEIERMAKTYLSDPVRISVGSTTQPTDNVKQETIKTTGAAKYDILLDKLNEVSGSFIVFVKTKADTETLADMLRGNGHEADAIHGDLRQRTRTQVIKSFRSGRNRILVATDVAARGLDIPHIECVVNYDLPQCPEDYIHRIGRTGRAGAEGIAINLISPQDNMKWRNICKIIDPEAAKAMAKEPSSSKSSRPFGKFGQKRRDDSRGFRDSKPSGPFWDKPESRSTGPKKPSDRKSFEHGGFAAKKSFTNSRPDRFASQKPSFASTARPKKRIAV